MCDLFGDWVPQTWIDAVMAACLAAPQHRYLFLTKNYGRVSDLQCGEAIPDSCDRFWYGATATTVRERATIDGYPDFISIEPLSSPFFSPASFVAMDSYKWVIIGAETGNRADRAIPTKEWFDGIVRHRIDSGRAVWVKDSLAHLRPEGAPKVFPW
jgi:protein gp37